MKEIELKTQEQKESKSNELKKSENKLQKSKSKYQKEFGLFKLIHLSNKDEIPKIAEEIIKIYPYGIKSLLLEKKLPKNSKCCLLIFKCSEDEFIEYKTKNENTEDLYSFFAAHSIKSLSLNSLFIESDDRTSKQSSEYTPINEVKEELPKYEELSKKNKKLIDFDSKFIECFEEKIVNFNSLIKEIQKSYLNGKKLEYNDFLLLFCSIIKYFCELDIKLAFSKTMVFLIFDAEEASLASLCEFFDYCLQLKPQAMKYKKEKKQNENLENQNLVVDEIKQSLIEHEEEIPFEKKLEKPEYWPPYMHYQREKNDKFRRYNDDDSYHECNNESSCKSTKFRQIDKLRVIFGALDYLINFSKMHKNKILLEYIFKKNTFDYKDNLKVSKIIRRIKNPLDINGVFSTLNLMRNYFGESFAFYCLWMHTYIKWLIFPSIIGILLLIAELTNSEVFFIHLLENKIHLGYYDIFLILFVIIISIWFTFYMTYWNQIERLYSYIWGMDDYEKLSQLNENFEEDCEPEDLVFGHKMPKESVCKQRMKKIVSSLVLVGMIALVCYIVFILFNWKSKKLTGDNWEDLKIGIYIASINGLQIKIMNFIYYFVAKYLNEWQNYYKLSDKNTSLAIKLLLFDFANSYSSLFYIAFVKPATGEKCFRDNCLREIEMQMYTLFFIYIGLYFFELAYYWGYMILKQRKLEKLKISNKILKEITDQSLVHLMLCDKISSMDLEMNNLIVQLGYVCLFSVAAPLLPLIAFVLGYIGSYVFYYKMIHLVRVETIDGAKGIGKYNNIIRILFFIGILVNVAIVLFSNPNLQNINLESSQVKSKFLVFGAVENVFLIIMYIVHWNFLPYWFKHIRLIRELYQTKFFYQ